MGGAGSGCVHGGELCKDGMGRTPHLETNGCTSVGTDEYTSVGILPLQEN